MSIVVVAIVVGATEVCVELTCLASVAMIVCRGATGGRSHLLDGDSGSCTPLALLDNNDDDDE